MAAMDCSGLLQEHWVKSGLISAWPNALFNMVASATKLESSPKTDSSSKSRATKSWDIRGVSLRNFGYPSQVGGGLYLHGPSHCIPVWVLLSGRLPPGGGNSRLTPHVLTRATREGLFPSSAHTC